MNSLFDLTKFENNLSTQWLGQSVCYFEELDSTNSFAKSMAKNEVKQGMICLTDNQTKGRGQYERNWESKSGKNLTFSLVFRPKTSERFHVLTLACALAIVEQLNELIDENPCTSIKWPNDVMLNKKKIAGLLTESVFNGNKPDRLVVGVGLNVNQCDFSPEVTEKATSISLEKGKQISREKLLSDLLGRIEYKYSLWHRQQTDLLKSINQNIIGYGQWVGLKVNSERRNGSFKLLGIDETGKLLLLNDDGGIESFSYEQIRLVTD